MTDPPVVVGAISYYGRADLVTAGVRDGVALVLDKRAVRLAGHGLPASPYHHEALEMPLRDAEELVRRVRQAVAERAREALSELLSQHRAVALVVPRSPFDRLPDELAEVLSSRPLTNAADGMMYRESLAEAGAALGMAVVRYPRGADLARMAASRLGVPSENLASWAKEQRGRTGAPWRKEHRDAAMAAVGELGQRVRFRL